MKVAIVGSEEKYWYAEQKEQVKEEIFRILYLWDGPLPTRATLVSGHCPKGGVDIWAEQVAEELGLERIIYKPQIKQWYDKGELKGYRSRNIMIAEECDVLYDIEPYRDDNLGYRRSGGTWTLQYAQKLSKEVHLVVIK